MDHPSRGHITEKRRKEILQQAQYNKCNNNNGEIGRNTYYHELPSRGNQESAKIGGLFLF